MPVRLVQLRDSRGTRLLAALSDEGSATRVGDVETVLELASLAILAGISLSQAAAQRQTDETIDLLAAEAEGRLLTPIDHPDPAHCHVTGTGLTHLGSAEGRDKMHKAASGGQLTDSLRMFTMGVEGGKPGAGQEGVQPEWFYKGDGSALIATGQPLISPAFALDGSEEPEIAGIYLIGADGQPRRLGFSLANEFSDHVIERANYLWLAHSKLRPAALGAELLLGDLPMDVRGTSRIKRNGVTLWEKPFLTGEANMSHSIGNLEAHHFKYEQFRRPGDVHVHFFGTATLSFAEGVTTQEGDVFELIAEPFRLPLSNELKRSAASSVKVTPL
ncbi:MAG: FAH family protein [Pseudomonadota bacterium]|nr:FAH family protein [Pseudomonadota bacterium]